MKLTVEYVVAFRYPKNELSDHKYTIVDGQDPPLQVGVAVKVALVPIWRRSVDGVMETESMPGWTTRTSVGERTAAPSESFTWTETLNVPIEVGVHDSRLLLAVVHPEGRPDHQ